MTGNPVQDTQFERVRLITLNLPIVGLGFIQWSRLQYRARFRGSSSTCGGEWGVGCGEVKGWIGEGRAILD